MPAEQLPLEVGHRNNFLFADHYLNRVLPDRRQWGDAQIAETVTALQDIWNEYVPDGDSEAQTEDAWVRPVLRALGHTYLPQVPVDAAGRLIKPDYVLFETKDNANATKAIDRRLKEADLSGAIAVADAKAWDLPLDKQLPHDVDIEDYEVSRNPAVQIDFYIRHTGLDWGILTNGRDWRLYHADSSKKLDVYYEVDLPALLDDARGAEPGDRAYDQLKYFVLFFRHEAFVGDPCWLDTVLEQSRVYEQGISDNLKEQVYEALLALARGFVAYPNSGLSTSDEDLKAIYDNSLIVLYRLLFTLFAEDRDLLPVRSNPAYERSYSLYALKRDIKRDLDQREPAAASMDQLWGRLTRLWDVINKGNPELGVQAYNGGLFAPQEHPFLTKYKVGDLHLRSAVDLLARAVDPTTGKREFVDYRDLEIRHLGSIYEGLLEFELHVADQPLAVSREKGRELYRPAEDGEDAEIEAGEPYLVTDKGERKRTGSYYTPDYIVQYIVEHAVGPVLEEIAEEHVDEPVALGDAVLSANVLDPAMGSGHFLVAATDFIAEFLVSRGAETPTDVGTESEMAYWRRRVVQACIYGVDINPLAVELAKLSLWLATVAKDKPLSFLDHHLRCGNSLIGARVADVLTGETPGKKAARTRKRKKEQEALEAGQLTMLEMPAFAGSIRAAVRSMDDLEHIRGDTLEQVQEAERIYRDSVRSLTETWRKVADVATARHFGLDIDDDLMDAFRSHVMGGGAFAVPEYESLLTEAEGIARARRFFHWELEFPEVFFDEHGRLGDDSGFDAVVGNPPWGASFGGREKDFLGARYATHYYRYESYILFLEIARSLTSHAQYFSYIVPSSLLAIRQAAPLRRLLLTSSTVHRIILLPQSVFHDVALDTIILVASKSAPSTDHLLVIRQYDKDDHLESIRTASPMDHHRQQLQFTQNDDHTIDLISQNVAAKLLAKIEEDSIQLEEIATVGQGVIPYDKYRGHTKEQISERIWHSDHQKDSTYVRELAGRDVGRYHYSWNGMRWISYGDWLAAPRRKEYFWGKRLVYQSTRNPSLSRRLVGTYIDEVFVHDPGLTLVYTTDAPTLLFLLAVLNSTLMNWWFLHKNPDTLHIYPSHLRKIPISAPELLADDVSLGGMIQQEEAVLGPQDVDPTALADGVVASTVTTAASKPGQPAAAHAHLIRLAERMLAIHKHRQDLDEALDPFKFLDRGVEFAKLPSVLAEEIKYGTLFREPIDLGLVHHDIDDMRLVPDGDQWQLQVQLKFRDPEDEWESWQYEEDGRSILRQWVTAYRLNLDPAKARYYEHALPVLGEFSNAKSFPGGKTRSTLKKLQLTRLPIFDEHADLEPLVELSEELADVQERIKRTDDLIDQIVYRLYGLTDEEIAIVEGRSPQPSDDADDAP